MDVRVLYNVEGNVGPNVMESRPYFISGRNGDPAEKKEGSAMPCDSCTHDENVVMGEVGYGGVGRGVVRGDAWVARGRWSKKLLLSGV